MKKTILNKQIQNYFLYFDRNNIDLILMHQKNDPFYTILVKIIFSIFISTQLYTF